MIYAILILIIDPYNFLGRSLIDSNLKRNISLNIEPHLYKLLEFKNAPKSNLVLGDSRSEGLFNTPETSNFINLAYGGGSVNEMIQTFWYIAEKNKLDTVLIGINFNLYNKYNTRFWIEETIKRKSNFFSYAFNRYSLEATFLIIKALVIKEEITLGKPQISREEFWQYQLNQTATKFYTQFLMPDNYYKELVKISRYCNENNIKIIYWIPPTHVEMQDRIKDFDLVEKEKIFKKELQTLGDLYDFDFPSELTKNKNNFSDPMHFNTKVAKIICDEIFKNKIQFSRYSCKKTNL
jgi:hypothetical protein